MHEGQGERKKHWRRVRADNGMNEEPERVVQKPLEIIARGDVTSCTPGC